MNVSFHTDVISNLNKSRAAPRYTLAKLVKSEKIPFRVHWINYTVESAKVATNANETSRN